MTSSVAEKHRASPYPGIRNYDADDAEWFFGRRREREVVISILFNFRSRLTVYYGVSGVGKTSLLLADVVPVLKGKKRPLELTAADRKRYDSSVVAVFRGWQDRHFQHSLREEIFAAMLEKMNRVSKGAVNMDEVALRKTIATELDKTNGMERDTETLAAKSNDEIRTALLDLVPLSELVTACCSVAGRIILIFDQFEEYFRYFVDSPERDLFDGEFATLVNSPEIPVTILVSLREDGLSKLDRLRLRIPNLLENMLRLEHLDEKGAREAIKAPLDRFNELRRQGAPAPKEVPQISLDEELVDALAREVAPKATATVDSRESAGTSENPDELLMTRYRGASYLQVLLASVWREVKQAGDNKLTVNTLIRAARSYADSARGDDADDARDQSFDFSTCARQIAASHVSYIMDRELETAVTSIKDQEDRKQIERLGLDRIRDTSARVLRYLVTPGGAKMAHTVETLTRWVNTSTLGGESADYELDEKEVGLTLRLLQEAGLLRCAEQGNTIATTRYEVAHDVLGPPLDKWREGYERKRAAMQAAEKVKADEENRIRDLLREEERKQIKLRAARLRRAASGFAVLALVAFGAMGVAYSQYLRANLAFRQAQYVRSADFSLQSVEAASDPAITRIAALSCIPAVSESKDIVAPPQALVALRFSTYFTVQDLAQKTPDWTSNQLTFLDSYLPSLLSPDKKWLVTLEGREPVVWNTEQLYTKQFTLRSADQTIVAIGFGKDSSSFFAECTDGSVIEWHLQTREQKRHPNAKVATLAAPRFQKTFPKELLADTYPNYSSFTADWTRDALAQVRALDPIDLLRLPAGTRTGRIPVQAILDAFTLGSKNLPEAKKQLIAATKEFIVMDENTAEGLIVQRNTQKLSADSSRLVEEANRLAQKGALDEAKAKYQEAMRADPNLKLNPENEATIWYKFGQYQTAIEEGYKAAAQNFSKRAIASFQRAKELRPDLWGARNPTEEAKRFVESPVPGPPSPVTP